MELGLISETPEFKGEVRVAARIIDFISSRLYTTPATCLKELINNSYDADATLVEVMVKPDADRIVIADNGSGMSKDEFIRHFKRISESHKRDKADETKLLGRPKIGMIGIGFVAANEMCDIVEVYSTKKGSPELLHVFLNFEEMRKAPEQRKRKNEEYKKADYYGEVLEAKPNEHYTRIFLKKVRGYAKEVLAGAHPQTPGASEKSLYGLSPESIEKQLKDSQLRSWDDFDEYSETRLKVALNVPVVYHKHWLPNSFSSKVSKFEADVAGLNFTVKYDGSELRKPIVLVPERGVSERAFISEFKYEGEDVSASGYFYAQHGNIKPYELQGLLVRIRHAAVGEYDHSFWEFPSSEYSLIQRWISAEIWADDRLEAAMNIDRNTLRKTHPAYVELRKAVHEHLRSVLSRAQKEIYGEGSIERKKEKTRKAVSEVSRIAKDHLAPVAPKAAEELIQAWKGASRKPKTQKALLKKYTVVQFYETVIEVAREVLSEEQLTEFMRRLTERLEN